MHNSLRWENEKLRGIGDFEYLKNEYFTWKRIEEPTKVSKHLFTKLELLIDDVFIDSSFEQQIKNLKKVRTWYDKHSEKKDVPQEKLSQSFSTPKIYTNSDKTLLKTHENRRLSLNSASTRIRNKMKECEFEEYKKNAINQWGLIKTRGTEDLSYKSELKKLPLINYDKKNRFHYRSKLKNVYEKTKDLLNPGHLSFTKEEQTPRKTNLSLSEILNLKQRLSKRKIHVSAKVIEPLFYFEEKKQFPKGGEYLLKSKNIK